MSFETGSLPDVISDAQFFIGNGLAVAGERRLNLAANMPPIPEVWPDFYNLDIVEGVLENLSSR